MPQPDHILTRLLRRLVFILAGIGGVALFAMVLVTCADVVLRVFKLPLKGAVDLIGIIGAISIACALPYTTAVKGHVAVEFFYLKLGRVGRIIVDTLARLLVITFFALLTWQCVRYGNSLRASGEVSPTLEMPVFWVPYLIAFCCVVIIAVKIYHLAHPGRSLIKP